MDARAGRLARRAWVLLLATRAAAQACVAGDKSCTSGERRRVVMLSFARPWNFGPYASQSRLLAAGLDGQGHTVFWLALGEQDERVRYGTPSLPPTVGYRGIASQNVVWYTSQLNRVLREMRADVLISLMDLTRIFVNEQLRVLAISWFPNHFEALDVHSAHALRAFDVVATLSPSDAVRLRDQLPSKRVECVPHIVTSDGQSRAARHRSRVKFEIPDDRYVVMMAFANYDQVNRKSADVSILAFKRLLQEKPAALLFVRAVIINDAAAANVKTLDVRIMLLAAGIPADSYKVDTEERTHEEAVDIVAMADVLLHPSKAEGFGMIVLEAQARGVPVISTGYGAMRDYTVYGIAVPPVQMQWLELGYAATPNVSGVSEALLTVARGGLAGEDRLAAIEMIGEAMSLPTVTSSFERLLGQPKLSADFSRLLYTDPLPRESPSYETVSPHDWTVVADSTHAIDEDMIRLVAAEHAGKPANVLVLQTLENTNMRWPTPEMVKAHHIPQRPVCMFRRGFVSQFFYRFTSLDEAIIASIRHVPEEQLEYVEAVGAVRVPPYEQHAAHSDEAAKLLGGRKAGTGKPARSQPARSQPAKPSKGRGR